MKRSFICMVVLALLLLVVCGTAVADEVKLTASDGAANDDFGWAVSVSGNVAVVGAYGDDDNGDSSGSAYIYRWDGTDWVEEEKLTASDGAANDYFGRAVSVSGDVVFVGVSGDDDNGYWSGSAYIYRWNGTNWVQEQKLTASDGAASDSFGSSVSVSGDVAIVGAFYGDGNAVDSGSAYIYRWDGTDWVQEQKLTASDGAANDRFGRAVSVSGDVVVVGADGNDDNGDGSGSAYIYRWNGTNWVQEQKLTASDGAASDYFGLSVSVSDDVAIVGAYFDDDNGNGSGSAYIYRWNGTNWVQEQKLTASDGGVEDYFGSSVSVSGDVAIVGTLYGNGNVVDSGSAYIYRWDGTDWVQEEKLTASDGAANDDFGWAVSVSGDVAVVGAYRDDDNGDGSGSAYIYRWDSADKGDDDGGSCFINTLGH